ncbi:2OG-Fe dioxygenase-domain-containing protein [Podospora appendiculata]|uniref:2OG-Fe dioxygenase-domain-containing protein n=1 Tax=Podospora appendiculata TaxID=314037 RepID=A0AAE0X5D6_9PEZI|nr:2OG-Fe dioxygenase-domain-containing protein [Podospora appendiculata]
MNRIYNSQPLPSVWIDERAAQQDVRVEVPDATGHVWPQTRPQLDIRKQAEKPEYYEAISMIMKYRNTYLRDRSVFVEGEDMVKLLGALGATAEDFEAIQQVSDHLDTDPTLPFRRSRNGRFCFDFGTRSVRRLEFQPFALSLEEDFKRHDSGQVRVFDEVQDELQLNTAFQALLVFKAMVCHGIATRPRPKLDYGSNKWVCTLFNLRTVTRPDMLGEPALEGVHTDGVDHTMTTYLGSSNMAPNSAVTLMHDMRETTGIRFNQIKPELIVARAHHRHFLDTLLIVDHERKHSISPVYAVDTSREATRDMLIFFTRRPVTRNLNHVSEGIDSLAAHRKMPMEIPLFVPEVID